MKRKNLALIPSVQTVYGEGKYRISDTFRYVLRFAILLCAVIGMNILINGMLGLKAEPAVIILTACYAFSGFYLLFRSVKGLISGVAILGFGLLVIILCTGLSPMDIFVGGFIGIVNSVIDVISSLGYVTIGKLSYDGISDVGIFTTVSTVMSVTVALSCRKRAHVLPLIFVSAAICSAYAMFGGQIPITDVALLLCAISAMAAMSVSDYRTDTHGRSVSAGLTAFVLAAALLLTPIVNVKKAMEPISFGGIGKIIQIMFPDGEESNVKRSSSPRRHLFTGRKIMTAYTNTASPLYLRNWAGGSYKNENWYSVDYDYDYSYSDFARGADSFELTKKFLQSANALGYNQEEIGIGLTDVRIVLATRQKNLPIPSMSGRLGMIYVDGDTKYESNIYDGVSTLDSLWKGEINTSAAVMDGNRSPSAVIHGFFEYLVGYCAHDIYPQSFIGKRFVNRYYKYGNDEYIELTSKLTGFAKSAYGEVVRDEAIDRAVKEIFENTDIEMYFDKVYLADGADAPKGMNVVAFDGYFYELSHYGMTHAYEVSKIVSDYLSQGRKYSTNPPKTGKSVTEELLFGSKQGYCVQFATVGTLIMRKLGFYARYAEGYLAQDFDVTNADSVYSYESKITDREGHAWTEVWIDGFGWMTCEMTPGFGVGNNDTPPPETSSDITETLEPITTPETSSDITDITETSGGETSHENTGTGPVGTLRPGPETTDGLPNGNGGRWYTSFVRFAVSAIIVLGVVVLVAYAITKADKNKKRLTRLIERGLRSSALNSAEKERIGELLTDALARAFNAYSLLPKAGELPEDFGKRLDASLQLKGLDIPLSVCVKAMSKQIYKGIMEEGEVMSAALTLQALSKNALIKLGVFKFLRYRLKGVI